MIISLLFSTVTSRHAPQYLEHNVIEVTEKDPSTVDGHRVRYRRWSIIDVGEISSPLSALVGLTPLLHRRPRLAPVNGREGDNGGGRGQPLTVEGHIVLRRERGGDGMSASFNFFNTFGATRLTLPAVEAELIKAVPCSHAHYVVPSPLVT